MDNPLLKAKIEGMEAGRPLDRPHGPRAHDGEIISRRIGEMWGNRYDFDLSSNWGANHAGVRDSLTLSEKVSNNRWPIRVTYVSTLIKPLRTCLPRASE